MKTARDILDEAVTEASSYDWQSTNYDAIVDKALQAIKQHYLGLIGEDEPEPPTTQKIIDGLTVYDQFDDLLRPGRNSLRAELRQAIESEE